MTVAYKAREVLLREGIYSEIVSIDASKTRRGCAYGLRLSRGNEREVKIILKRAGVDFGDIS